MEHPNDVLHHTNCILAAIATIIYEKWECDIGHHHWCILLVWHYLILQCGIQRWWG